MVNERLKSIERPVMTSQTKERLYREITSEQTQQTAPRSSMRFPKTITVMLSSLVAVILWIIVNTQAPQTVDTANVNSVAIENITKVTIIENAAPEKWLDVSSPFYLDRKESVDRDVLNGFEVALQNADTVPFSWEGIDVYETDDMLFELANGEAQYVKSFMASNGDTYTVNMQTMEQYVMTASDELLFWDARNAVFVGDPYPSWPYFAIGLVLAYFFMTLFLRPSAKAPDAKEMPTWVQMIFVALLSFSSIYSDKLFGSLHIGAALAFITVLASAFYFVNMRYYNTSLRWWNFVEFIVLMNLITFFFGFL